MASAMKTFFFIYLILLVYSFAGNVEGFEDHTKTVLQVHKTRKLKVIDVELVYDYGGHANPKHDPRTGKPPGGVKNP